MGSICKFELTTTVLDRTTDSILVYWVTPRNFQITFLPNTGCVVSNAITKFTWLIRISWYLERKIIRNITDYQISVLCSINSISIPLSLYKLYITNLHSVHVEFSFNVTTMSRHCSWVNHSSSTGLFLACSITYQWR